MSGLYFTHKHTHTRNIGAYHVVGRHYTSTDNLVMDSKEQSKLFVGEFFCFYLWNSSSKTVVILCSYFYTISYHVTHPIIVIGYQRSMILIGLFLDNIVPRDHPIIVKEPIVYSLSLVAGMWSITALGFVLALIFLFINIKYSNVK